MQKNQETEFTNKLNIKHAYLKKINLVFTATIKIIFPFLRISCLFREKGAYSVKILKNHKLPYLL